jgi:hypothetical protein
MKKYNKGLTISKEEMELIGFYIENAVNHAIHNGTSIERFNALREIRKRLAESKK